MSKFNIIHVASGLTLRQYAKQHKVPVLQDGAVIEYDFFYEKLTYLQFEGGGVGFKYRVLIPGETADMVWCLGPGFAAVEKTHDRG